MSPNSSTSSFEPNRLESFRPARWPLAALLFVLSVIGIETLLWCSRDWFSDRAAGHWQSKQALIEAGQLDGDVAVLGSSVTFHSVRAPDVETLTGSEYRVVNLALNGLHLQHQTQLLRRYLEDQQLELLVLELRHARVPRRTWLSGPYWRFWARADEFSESCFWFEEPSLIVPFVGNRLLASFAYRKSIRNCLSVCFHSRSLNPKYRDRNREARREMAAMQGYGSPNSGLSMEIDAVPEPMERLWEESDVGRAWLDEILRLCAARSIRVAILLPPCPPFIEADRKRSGFYDGFHGLLEQLRRTHPELGLELLAPRGYALADFSDDHHFSTSGSRRLTEDFATWLDARTASRLGQGD